MIDPTAVDADGAARPKRRLALGLLLALYTGGLLLLAIGVTATVVGWRFSESRTVNISVGVLGAELPRS